MDSIKSEEFQYWTIITIIVHVAKIVNSRPKIFSSIALCFVMPVSLVILSHAYILQPVTSFFGPKSVSLFYILFLLSQFLYLFAIFICFLFALAATVFTVAALYISLTTTFSTIISAVPRIFSRLIVTLLWVSLFVILYHTILYSGIPIVIILMNYQAISPVATVAIVAVILFCTVAHVYVTMVWQLASVVSVLEPVGGLAAINKSRALLKGKMAEAMLMTAIYIVLSGVISSSFAQIVVYGDDVRYATWEKIGWRVLFLVLQMALVLGWLLLQSILYFACKSFHHETIDKNALADVLGGYIKTQVRLNSLV